MCFSAITLPLPLQAHFRKDTPMAPPLLPVLSLSSWSVAVMLNRTPALPWSSLSDWIFKLPDIIQIISLAYLWNSRFIFWRGKEKLSKHFPAHRSRFCFSYHQKGIHNHNHIHPLRLPLPHYWQVGGWHSHQ